MEDQPKPKTILYQCGACFHWERREGEGVREIGKAAPGICWGAPPTPRAILGNHREVIGQQNMRPMTRENERACGAFLPQEAAGALLSAAPPLDG